MSLNHTRYLSHDDSLKKKDNKIQQIEKDDLTNYDFKQEINIDQEYFTQEKNNFFNSLLKKYRDEIKLLKDYINRLQKVLRRNLNIEIPFLLEAGEIKPVIAYNNENKIDLEYKQDKKENENNSEKKENKIKSQYDNIDMVSEKSQRFLNTQINLEKYQKDQNFNYNLNLQFLKDYFDETLSSLINIEYINPILITYDNHVKILEEEITQMKTSCKKYETKIIDLTQENKALRENLLIKANELKDIVNIRVESTYNKGIVYDEEYFKQIDERNNILSKENEIILLNYQKIYNEYIEFQANYLEKHNENMKKVEIFDKIYEQLNQANINIDNLILKNQICENKLCELVEKNTKDEVELEAYRLEFHKLKSEIQSLTESNIFYKNLISKMNS